MSEILTIPDNERETFEVWEVYGGYKSRVIADVDKKYAKKVAKSNNAEALENFRMESGGPVKPTLRKFFVVKVQVTEKREVV